MRRTEHKIVDQMTLLDFRKSARSRHESVVFTNGCFDLLHPGHIRYLETARALGDVLYVGLNSDDSVRRLKGEGRPLNSDRDRSIVVAGLEAVSLVTIFDDDTAKTLVSELQPDVYVKGGDYSTDPDSALYPAEAKSLASFGGQFKIVPFTPDYSTSRLIHRIREST